MVKLNNKGISEVIGFIFIFGLVVGIVAFVFVSGLPAIDFANTQNKYDGIKKQMIILKTSQDDILEGNNKIIKNKVIAHDSEFQVSETSRSLSINGDIITTDSITHTTGENTVSYEFGSLIKYSGQPIMMEKPVWNIQEKTAIIKIPDYNNTNEAYISGASQGVLTSKLRNVETKTYTGDVNITIISVNSGGWANYYQQLSQDYSNVDYVSNENEIKLELNNYNRIILKKYEIESRIEVPD